jgi:hypothetical protein
MLLVDVCLSPNCLDLTVQLVSVLTAERLEGLR